MYMEEYNVEFYLNEWCFNIHSKFVTIPKQIPKHCLNNWRNNLAVYQVSQYNGKV
jgi:hypothetical protein